MKSPTHINNWGLRETLSKCEPNYFQRQRNTTYLQILPNFQRRITTSNGQRVGTRIRSFMAEKPRKVEEYFSKNVPNLKHQIRNKGVLTPNNGSSIRTTIACTNFVRVESTKDSNYNFSPKNCSLKQNATIDYGYIGEEEKRVKRLFSPQDLSTYSNFGQYNTSGKRMKQSIDK